MRSTPLIIPKPAKWLAFFAGTVLFLLGVMLVLVVIDANVRAGHLPLAILGASTLLASMPLLALPFSSQLFRILLAGVLAGFAALMLWLALGQAGSGSSTSFQLAAFGLTALLVARLGLALRSTGTR